jgi:D-proline reductase (dithiol) PrdB
MCHQSVGLLCNSIEAAGISTVCLTMNPFITVNVRVPRAVWVRFPLGFTFGEAKRPDQHRKILVSALDALELATEPETFFDTPYRWRRF